jgi:hypothetical protein
MATQLGAAVSFGFTGTDGIAASQLTGKIILQSADLSKAADVEEIRDADGDVVNRTFYNQSQEASLEFIPTGGSMATARTNGALLEPGAIVNITACADIPELVATNWIVDTGGRISGSNTGAKRVTLPLKRHAGVTAAAT